MASQGPNSPGTIVNDNSFGTIAWSNPANAASSNNVYAIAFSFGGGVSNYLKATNFGFSIPSGATIDGIKVTIEAQTSAGSTNDSTVKLVKSGLVLGSNLGTSLPWNNVSDSTRTYGSSSNLWGLSWTDADINDSTFGVAYSSTLTAGKSGARNRCDYISITVYYTTGSGPTSASALLLAGD